MQGTTADTDANQDGVDLPDPFGLFRCHCKRELRGGAINEINRSNSYSLFEISRSESYKHIVLNHHIGVPRSIGNPGGPSNAG